jgi:hypothetical protein
MSLTRPLVAFFFIRTAKNGSVVPPIPRFRSDLCLHPSGEPRPSLAPRGALGDSRRNKCAGNAEESSRASGDPDLSTRKGGHPYRIVFHASSPSAHHLPRAVKACRRRTCSHAAMRVNARPPIYPAYRASSRIHPLLPSPLSSETRRAMADYGSDDGAANNGFSPCSLHQWERHLLYMAGYSAPPDFRVRRGWRLSAGGVPIPPPPVAPPSTPPSKRSWRR